MRGPKSHGKRLNGLLARVVAGMSARSGDPAAEKQCPVRLIQKHLPTRLRVELFGQLAIRIN